MIEESKPKKDKKLGGVFVIDDEDLRTEMIRVNSEGKPCDDLDAFTAAIFEQDKLTFHDAFREDSRYIVCFMPAGYEHDLSNEVGCASPMDAAKAYVDIVIEGFSVFVWDKQARTVHYTEQNLHIYQSLETLQEQLDSLSMTHDDLANIVGRLSTDQLVELKQLIEIRLGPGSFLQIAKCLAKEHRTSDTKITRIMMVPQSKDDDTIRLIEVTGSVGTTNEVLPFTFGPQPEKGLHFAISVILLSEKEYDTLQAGDLELPDDWGPIEDLVEL